MRGTFGRVSGSEIEHLMKGQSILHDETGLIMHQSLNIKQLVGPGEILKLLKSPCMHFSIYFHTFKFSRRALKLHEKGCFVGVFENLGGVPWYFINR